MHWGKILIFYLLRKVKTMKASMHSLYITLGIKLCIIIFTCDFCFFTTVLQSRILSIL